MNDVENIIHGLTKENVVGEKHEKRLILGINILAAIWRLITFWKQKNDNDN